MGRLQRTAAKRSEVCGVRPRTREIILNKPFSPGPNEPKYFEDYPEGGIFELGSVVVDETECVEFAKRYDPQCFHVDPAAAKKSIYGGLITSGWHTGGMMMRLIADNFLSDESSLGSSGIEKLNCRALSDPVIRCPSASRFSRPECPDQSRSVGFS